MKKFLVTMGFALALFGCDKANDIFDNSTYDWNSTMEIDGNLYDAPVYLNATAWGSVAYVDNRYVNKGVKLLISQNEDAEGGMEYDVTSNIVRVDELSLNTLYYYCLKYSGTDIKSTIKNAVTGDVSSLSMEVVERNDSLVCELGEIIDPVFIIEKGFIIDYDYKYIIDSEQSFAVSKEDVVNQLPLWRYDGVGVYAYIQTSNAYYRSADKSIEQMFIGEANDKELVFTEIVEKLHDDNTYYFECTVTGKVDSLVFECRDWNYNQYALSPTAYRDNGDGSTTYYLKKDFYHVVYAHAYYRHAYSDGYISSDEAFSEYYNVTQFDIYSAEDFIKCANLNVNGCTLTLMNDIVLPTDTRISLQLSDVILDGNGQTIDGVSYFPLFRDAWGGTVKNLKIGTNETVYNVKKGTYSTTTNKDVPMYLLTEDYDVTFTNCEIRGIISVFDRDDFYVSPEYHNYHTGNDSTTTESGYVEKLSGLKDYTTTVFR